MFTLAAREPATLEFIDVAGRRIWRRKVGTLGPGPHRMPVGNDAHVPPGIYLIRLRQGACA